MRMQGHTLFIHRTMDSGGSTRNSGGASSGGGSAMLEQVSAHLTSTAASRASGPAASVTPVAAAAAAQKRPNGYGTDVQIHDLLIANGRVIDPANGIDAVLDVAVRWGKISAVGERLDPASAAFVYDATGLIVAPGLIDAHVHCFTACTTLGIPADEYCLGRGCTTVIDAGSAGPHTLPAFKEFIVQQQQTRVLSMCHVASAGLANGVFVDPYERRVRTQAPPTHLDNVIPGRSLTYYLCFKKIAAWAPVGPPKRRA